MNTLDSLLDGIKIQQQQDAVKKQDSYLDDVSIFDFSNALQFANQANNFGYDAVQNNSNDIISQHAVSATPYQAASSAQEHSYQRSLDEAASKYNLNKNTHTQKEHSTAENTVKEHSHEAETSTHKHETKEVQSKTQETTSTKEVAEESSKKTTESTKEEAKTQNATQETKVQTETKTTKVDAKLLESMDKEITLEDAKKAKELIKDAKVETKAEAKVEVEAELEDVKLEAKVETNVKVQEKAQVAVKDLNDTAPKVLQPKANIEAKVEVEAKSDDLGEAEMPELEVATEAQAEGEEGMLFGQKQDAQTNSKGKESGLPSNIAFSTASKRAAFNRVFSTASQPKSLEESNILNQVVRKVSEKMAQNNPKISISLTPDKLGKVDVDFISGKNGVTAQITAESSQVKEVLSKNLNSLRESLASQGVSVSNINIKVEKSEESNNANLDFNKDKEFDLGQQGEQAGDSNFAQEGNEGNKTAYTAEGVMQDGLDGNLEAESSTREEENKPSQHHEHSTVEYQA